MQLIVNAGQRIQVGGTNEARMVWPNGTADEWQKVKADAFYVLTRGERSRAR
jgi:hypothetical protein